VSAYEADWQHLKNALILLLVFVFCLYLPSLFYEAFADDDVYLAFANRFLREANLSDLHQFFLRAANPIEFLPLRDLSYWLDFRLYGDDLNGFHATNLLWYAASGLASFWLFRELILLCKPEWSARANTLSLCGTLLFVGHPAHVEVVAWIASRKDLIGGVLGFLAQAFLARALRRNWPWYDMLLAALLLFAACFGKASAMTGILFVTALIGVGWRASPEVGGARKFSYLILFWVLLAIAFMIHFKVGEASGILIENHPGLWAMLDRASRILTALIGILLLPYPMRFYYDVYQLGNWHWLVSASAALLLVVALRVLWQSRSLWALGVVLLFSPLLVYLQLMPFTTWSLASERFVFVSVAGLALLLIDLLGRIDSPKKIGGLLLLIVLPCAVTVWSRIGEWGDIPHQLLFREYMLQPGFHNVVRDRIVYKLLPEKRYAEAAVLTRQVPRAYAAEALFALVEAEQAYRQMSEAESVAVRDVDGAAMQKFCSAVVKLRSATCNGYAQMPTESDVSYNNILRTLDKELKFSYGAGKSCVGEIRPDQ
jgi:hypothetical protein